MKTKKVTDDEFKAQNETGLEDAVKLHQLSLDKKNIANAQLKEHNDNASNGV